jgi:hypothetical protein
MGMSDRQYEDSKIALLREIDRIKEEIIQIKKGELSDSPSLLRLERDTIDYLKRP